MLNKSTYTLFFFSSIIFCNSNNILTDINSNLNWVLVEEIEAQKVYKFYNPNCECTYSKVEKPVEYNESDIFNVIRDINGYNIFIRNKTLNSNLISIDNDTIYAYQTVKNSIPFVRDRQYVFKMYTVSKDHIEWIILDKKSDYLTPYLNADMKTLTLGAGSWSFRYDGSEKYLMNKIYVNDEVNLPSLFINKLKRNSVVKIFNDILNHIKKIKRG